MSLWRIGGGSSLHHLSPRHWRFAGFMGSCGVEEEFRSVVVLMDQMQACCVRRPRSWLLVRRSGWSKGAEGLRRCGAGESFRVSIRAVIRCCVVRDERENVFASVARREEVAPGSGRHWRGSDDREEGALLFKESSEPVSAPFRKELTSDEAEESIEAPVLLDSRVEALEGVPGRRWLSAFVESVEPRVRGIVVLNLLACLYGSNVSAIKEAELILDPASFSVGRFAIAALVFAPFLKDAVQPGIAKAGFELGVWASIGYLAQALGLMTTDAGRASFFTTFTVLTVPFIAGLMGKKIPLLTWFAAVAALFGVGLLETSGAPPSVGDAWSLLSSVVFGIHLIRTEHHSRVVSPGGALSIISMQLCVITVSAFMWSFASHATTGDSILLNLGTLDWPGLYQTALSLPLGQMVYTGLFSTAFCLSAELFAMRDVSATEAAVITTMEPLWGAAFAWCVLGERWGLRGWVGAAFILGGSLATQVWGSPETPVKRSKVPLPTLEEQEAQRLSLLIEPPLYNLEGDRADRHRPASRRRK